QLELLDDRPRPSVRDDDRQRVLVPRTNVDEMNVETVDLGDEVRHCIEPRLGLAPVVLRAPVTGELLDGRERHALREIRDGFALGQARRTNTPAKILEVGLRKVDAEGTDAGGNTHDLAPLFALVVVHLEGSVDCARSRTVILQSQWNRIPTMVPRV